jgi:hypothetical protein
LFLLIFSWKDGIAEIQFSEDASHRPGINGGCVCDSQDDLRSPIEAALNVRVYLFWLEAP